MGTIEQAIRAGSASPVPTQRSKHTHGEFRASDALDPGAVTLATFHCVREAMQVFRDRKRSAALIVDAQQRPVGEFSIGDALAVLSSGAYHQNRQAGCRTVREAMRSAPLLVGRDCDAFSLAQRMHQQGHEVAGVMDCGRLLGTVSRDSLLSLFAPVHDPQCHPKTDRHGTPDCVRLRIRSDRGLASE